MDRTKQRNDHGLFSATASILTDLFGHCISSWSLQTTKFGSSFDSPSADIDRLGNMLVRRQTRGRIQPVVVHSRYNHTLCDTIALSRAVDDDLRTSLQRRFHPAARERDLHLVLLEQERHCSPGRTVRPGRLRSSMGLR